MRGLSVPVIAFGLLAICYVARDRPEHMTPEHEPSPPADAPARLTSPRPVTFSVPFPFPAPVARGNHAGTDTAPPVGSDESIDRLLDEWALTRTPDELDRHDWALAEHEQWLDEHPDAGHAESGAEAARRWTEVAPWQP